ncbi:telomere-associated protein RIF1 isoform X2 [Archocentrus centrarchus]|uniref:telomere-associated protein RIF1 isoform X2 n=1 Tax=Archocentrus centrarchus TaxID=63155 RepID=UPI0011E9FE14|nr:telomere-associated protein RIF1 isoform X2 [Archocentrus centrarchus]
MMATAGPPSASSFLPLLESLEDNTAGQSEQTDAYLTIANRLSGEEGRQFLPAVEKHFPRLGKVILDHITSPNAELSQAALQALGFCVYHSHVVSGVSEVFAAELLSALCSLVAKSADKNTCTRALWVISKQSFPAEVVAKKVPSILGTLESVWKREDIHSVVMEHEALNVIIRMLEQVPTQMGEGAVQWANLVIPLVVHSASKVRLRAAAAMEMGMPLLLEKQTEVAAVIEPMMSTKLIPELQKLFMSKNETNVLKLWPLFVKLLGKLLHRGGPFINSLLHLEELGFRSSSPTIKKIAFLAWKSLIDNFALNPDILCSAKRMKLLMQPLTSIHVRTEALLLTKVEVWWYLVVQLGPNLSPNFDQVSVPLLQCTIGSDSPSIPGTPSRGVTQNSAVTPAGTPGFNSPTNTSRISLNSSVQLASAIPSIQLLGLEMLLHYFLGPEVVAAAAKNKLTLSLEPLNHPLLSGASSFTKHAAVLISNTRDGFTNIGKDAPDSLLTLIWTSLVQFVNLTIESGSKKDRQGSEVLTLMLQALQSIITSEALRADRVLVLFEATVKGIPQRVLSSASYQVGKMDVLNGTPALFLILLLYNSSMLPAYIKDERFFHCLQKLVGCGLSGPTSPLAFAEAVLGAISFSAGSLQNQEQLLRMWSVVVSSLTDIITQTNEVNQGDALEHNFSAVHSALMLPITHLLHGSPLPQVAQKSMLSSWSKLYKVFARCSALVVTAEENICCEELCAKMAASIDRETLMVPSTLNAVASILHVMVECVDFSPYTPQFQQKLKSPHTPVNWMRKRNKALGNLFMFQSLLVQCLEVYLDAPETSSEATGLALVSILSALFTNLVLASAVQEALNSMIQPLTLFYKHAASDPPKFNSQVLGKLEKLLGEVFSCLQTRSTLAYNDELLAVLSPLLCVVFPHKNKHLRTSVTHFWNSTFANAVSLTYPDEIRPLLSQVKQKTPIILPGFEVVSVPDELSGQYSSENSQLETKLSGMPVSSVGKRDSLLGKTAELKEKSSIKNPKPVSTKLDFGSPKPPRREVLEEEASIDFVFIPPEAKERVLTEHQKEVKRTKRVDIPAMYNNLDASLDTTAFTQYTQSQEDSLEKLPAEQADIVTNDAPGKLPQTDIEIREDAEVLTEETQDYASPKDAEKSSESNEQEEIIPKCADVLMEEHPKSDDVDMESKEGTSPNISASSDLVSGTPQKSNSRRQSFITLEKYAEGKPASPSTASSFTGPLVKISNSQECSKTNKTSASQASRPVTTPDSQDSQSPQTGECNSQCSVSNIPESPRRPKDCRTKTEPVKLTERLCSDSIEDENVIPDTQTEMESIERASVSQEIIPSSQEEESESALEDSQSSSSPSEPRRSGRHRVRPLLPGEDPEEREAKYTQFKRRRSGEEPTGDFPKSDSMQNRPNTRSKQAAEEMGRDRLRSRAQRDSGELSQTSSQGRARKRVKLNNSLQELLDKPERRKRSTSEHGSSQTAVRSDKQSNQESQSQGRHNRQSKASLEVSDKDGLDKKVLPDKKEYDQTGTHTHVKQTEKDKEPDTDSQTVSHSQTDTKSQELVLVGQTENDGEKLKDSEMVMSSPQVKGQSQESEPVGNAEKDSQVVTSSPVYESQVVTSTTKKLSKELLKDEHNKVETIEDSQVNTPSSTDSHSKRRSRRSKASSEVAESEEKNYNTDSLGRQTRSNSQITGSVVSQAEAQSGGRTRRSKVLEEQSKSNPSYTPESSQSLVIPGSESSQGKGRYSTRRSAPALLASMESSESESPEVTENSVSPKKKRGRKSRASLQSLPTIESKDKIDNMEKVDSSAFPESDIQSTESKDVTDLEESKTQDLPSSESIQCTGTVQSKEELPMEVDIVVVPETEADDSKQRSVSASEREQTNRDDLSTHNTGDSEIIESVEICSEKAPEELPHNPCLSTVETLVPPDETTQRVQVWGSSEEKVDQVLESGEVVTEKQKLDSKSDPQGHLEEDTAEGHSQNQMERQEVAGERSEEEQHDASNQHSEASAEEETTPLAESKKDGEITEEEQNTASADALTDVCSTSLSSEHTSKGDFQDSPVKQKDLEAVMGPDVGHSPNSGRTRGTWSPSASPSTSILKKGQKRPLEVDTPSPLVKSRRVSFANPIQQQETADDIDRRSPAIRTSSPRRSRVTSIPQPKHITTPTKGLVILSPRNLHSPGYKSSKKCLISEMGQEPRPVSKDCIYPALVGCSTPVEAVLPQISSNMWSRGFGQLVRARNIKTVGDLSALTPSEIKTLPVRSPKISNVKKALKLYEQQRKGRGGDELKSFDETEMMTSELEETSAPQNPEEENKPSGDSLATELVDEPVCADGRPEQDASRNHTPEMPDGDEKLEGQLPPDGLPSEVEALSHRMTPQELRVCSPQQLVDMHDQLGGMMRRVVAELQTRLCQTDCKH